MQLLRSGLKKLSKHPTRSLLIATTIISFIFFLWGINSWKYVLVGDEWSFYIMAKRIAASNTLLNPFSFTGVFGSHSMLASLYQALFLDLFGTTNFAWRLSNIILIFPISLFFYLWVKESFEKSVAVISTIILQCSFYLANFFKIGYDNPQSLTLFLLSLLLVTKYAKKPTNKLGFILGVVLGISFYIYIGPIFPLLLWPYIFLLLQHKDKRQVRKTLIYMAAGYFLLLLPLLFNLQSILNGPMGTNSAYVPIHQKIINIGHNLLLFYKNNDWFYNHFVSGPYVDIVTGIFCFIGTIYAVRKYKHQPYALLLAVYLNVAVMMSLTSAHPVSPTTRGIFFLPFGFVFAGIGMNLLQKRIKNRADAILTCMLILEIIFVLNVYQSQIGVFKDKAAGYSGMALFVKELQTAQHTDKPVTLVASSSLHFNLYLWIIPIIEQAYKLESVQYKVVQPGAITCASKEKHYFVFHYDSEAREHLKKLNCGKENAFTYSLLSPQMRAY